MAETVSLKEYTDALLEAERRRNDDLRIAAKEAVDIALQRNNEVMALHNDLIRKGERAAATYITRGQVYAALGTVLIVLGLAIAWMGVS